MYVLDRADLKKAIFASGMKQKTLAEKVGLSEITLCLILQGKRKCEAGEYASICKVLGVSYMRFMNPRLPEREEV